MQTARRCIGAPVILGIAFAVFFSWSPGESQQDAIRVVDEPKSVVTASNANRTAGLMAPKADGAARHSPFEQLHKAELELFRLKLERHRLQRALEHMQPRLRKRPSLPPLRRPCT